MNLSRVKFVEPTVELQAKKDMMVTCLAVKGLENHHDQEQISENLLRLKGVQRCIFEKYAFVAFDPQQIGVHDMVRAVATLDTSGRNGFVASIEFVAPLGDLNWLLSLLNHVAN